jgi:hypothetical protein
LRQNLSAPPLTAGIKAGKVDMLQNRRYSRSMHEANPDLKGNIRDYATINELICLSRTWKTSTPYSSTKDFRNGNA